MWKRILPLLFAALVADAQNYTISTFAGGGAIVPGQSATSYAVNWPAAVAVDSAGNLYIALQYRCQVWVVNSSGTLTQVIGNGTCAFSGDNGPAASAQLDYPQGVAVDSSGNLYIADSNRIRKVSGGIITTVAGNGIDGYNGDNISATSAELFDPCGVAVDSSGNLYIADAQNNRIRKVSGGIITTVAGNGTRGYNGDNISATSAELNFPQGVAVDSSGNLYIADYNNYRIRKVSGGIITTAAGDGNYGYNGENIVATSAGLSGPNGVAVDSSGNVYIAELGGRIGKVSGGIITTVAGNGTLGYNGDNISATSAELYSPASVALDSSGNLYIADMKNYRIRKVSGGIITTVAGNGLAYGGDGNAATNAQLTWPEGSAMDSSGNLFVADTYACVVRKVAAGTGIISTAAGNGICGYNNDNISATSAELNYPQGVAVDSSGNLYIADADNQRIRKVSGGIITTVAGSGASGYNGDNISPASAELNFPEGVAVDSSGNLYIADSFNSRIRKVSGGNITTVAGNGTGGYNGDNISAGTAELNNPLGIAVDSSGNLYIADTNNFRIRKVSGGIITTVAGNGTNSYAGDGGSATSAWLSYPQGVAVDSSGNLYIADTGNARVRRVSGGIITTVAGNGTWSFSGDGGSATSAELNYPGGVAVDSSGNIYIADTYNNRIRELTPAATVNVTSSPSGLKVIVDGTSYTTPQLFVWTPGSNHTFNASTQSGGTGTQLVPVGAFPVNQSFSNTSSAQTFNVNFTTQYYLTTSASTGGTISPPSGWYNSGSGVSVSATPGSGYNFAGFSGALTGTTTPQTVTMSAPESVTANFTLQTVNFTVSGTVTVGGAGLTGVTINVNGSETLLATTGFSGSYSFTLAGGGTYTLSASLSGYSFSAPITFSNLSANQTANFTGASVAGLDFYPVTPCRIADTRTGAGFTGQFGPPTMAAQQTRTFPILSSPCAAGIPATVAAYSLNFTVAPPAGGPEANLTTWPTGLATGMPNVSTLNYYSSVVANAAIVPAGTNGGISVYVNYATDVLFDINGYFAPPLSSGLEFYPVAPCRIADTRTGAGFSGQYGPPSMAGGAARTFTISSSCGIPATASAYSLNFTVAPPSGGPEANLTTWPATQPTMPNVSTLNYYGSVVANAAIVPAGTNGAINVYVVDPTNVLFDTNGYFAPAQASGLHFYPLPPCRIADTRSGAGFTGQFGPPTMGAGTTRTFTLPASSCEVPATAAAYSLNFTVVPAGGPAANLTTWPAGLAAGMPNVSTLNYSGSVVANAAIVPAGTNGAINVYVNYATDVLFDINGYFAQ